MSEATTPPSDSFASNHTDIMLYFDKYIPFGGKHDIFKGVAKQMMELGTSGGDLLVAWAGVQDYGDKINAVSPSKPDVQDSGKMFNSTKDVAIPRRVSGGGEI